jgi:hypothetical protein
LKEVGYKHFYLPFYQHDLSGHELKEIHLIKSSLNEITGIKLEYDEKVKYGTVVQGVLSRIPTFDFRTKVEKNKQLVKGIIEATVKKKIATKQVDPTMHVTPEQAKQKLSEINVMTCDIFILFAY